MKTIKLFFSSIFVLFSLQSNAFDLTQQSIDKMQKELLTFKMITDCPNSNITTHNIINKGKTEIFLKKGFNHCNVIFINEHTIQCKLQEQDLLAIYNEKKSNTHYAISKLKNLESITGDDFSFDVYNKIINDKNKCLFKKNKNTFLANEDDIRFYMTKKYINQRSITDNKLYKCESANKIIYNPLYDINEHIQIEKINEQLCSYDIKTENHTINCLFDLSEESYNKFVSQHIDSYLSIQEDLNHNNIFFNFNKQIVNQIENGTCKINKSF